MKRKPEKAGYRVRMIADNAADGPPFVLPADIRLRGLQDGIDTADQIRRGVRVPVEAQATEPCGCLVKPFPSADPSIQIEEAPARRKAISRNSSSLAGEWMATERMGAEGGLDGEYSGGGGSDPEPDRIRLGARL